MLEEYNQNKKNRFLCDICGYEWEIYKEDDLLRKELSLENDMKEEIPRRCPSCGNSYTS